MNEKERRSKPEDQNPARAQQPGAADVPSRERKAEQEATRSAAGESSGLEATMGMNPTESFAERPAKADAAKDSVPQAATKPAAPSL